MTFPKSPCADQTEEEVEGWLRENVAVGAEVAIRQTQGGLLRYQRGRIVRVAKGRFEVAAERRDGTYSESGETFYSSGKNCWHPKGQTRLVIPSPAVVAACEVCSRGTGYLAGTFTTSFA